MLTKADDEIAPPNLRGYKLIKKIGEGGAGVVYEAQRESDDSTVAVKLILFDERQNEEILARFEREIAVTKTLSHPNIVELYEYGSHDDWYYFTMELCRGGSLSQYLKNISTPLAVSESIYIIQQVLDGLSFAHEKGFIHRDIKPQNILLTDSENFFRVKISDFGTAKSFEEAGFSNYTQTGTVIGTESFMPREQWIDFKYVLPVSDVWSAGATFYYLLTKQYPRDISSDQDPIQAIFEEEVIPIKVRNSNIPDALAQVIDRSLADDADERYQSAKEFRQALIESLG